MVSLKNIGTKRNSFLSYTSTATHNLLASCQERAISIVWNFSVSLPPNNYIGNRNFEGRIHPDTRANYLASPPLVIAYALAGRVDIDFETEPLGFGSNNEPIFLRDIWPNQVLANFTPKLPHTFRGDQDNTKEVLFDGYFTRKTFCRHQDFELPTAL